jgi:hypothetical protein
VPPPEPKTVSGSGTAPAGWDGRLEGWYEGECVSLGNRRYDFRSPLGFDVVYHGPVEGHVFWSMPPEVTHDGIVSGTTGHLVSGLMDDDNSVMVSTAWQGLLVFEGMIDDAGHGQGTVVWERDYELCTGSWAAD